MPDRETSPSVDLDESDPKSAPTFLAAGVGTIVLVIVVLLLEALYHRTAEAELYRKVIAEQPQELRSVHARQLEQLQGYRWIDQTNGIAAIPIDRAIELVVEEAQSARADESAAP